MTAFRYGTSEQFRRPPATTAARPAPDAAVHHTVLEEFR